MLTGVTSRQQWVNVRVDLVRNTQRVIFTAERGGSELSDLAIDDVLVLSGSCQAGKLLFDKYGMF